MVKLPNLTLFIIASIHCCAFAAAEKTMPEASIEQQLIGQLKQNKIAPNSSISFDGKIMPLICTAALAGQRDLLKYLHETANISLNTIVRSEIKECDGLEPIHLAIRGNSYPIVDYLIKHGISPNTLVSRGQSQGQSPVHMACYKNTLDALKALRSYPDTDFNEPVGPGNPDRLSGFSPIHLAAINGNVPMIQWLHKNIKKIKLDTPADKTSFYSCFTPFHLATLLGHLELVKYFCEVKLDPHQTIKGTEYFEGYTPFHIACRKGIVYIVDYLHSAVKIPLDMTIKRGLHREQKPIHLAAQFGNLDLAIYLHKNLPGCVNTPISGSENDFDGLRPIQLAAWFGRLPIIKYLHEQAKVRLDEVVPRGKFAGYSLIHIATSFDHPEIVHYLLENMVNPDEGIKENALADRIGSTPLFIAIKANNNEIVKDLIAAGASTKPLKLANNNCILALESVALLNKNAEALGYLRGKPACNKCFNDGSLKCARCEKVHYCSSACQKADWTSHKASCNNEAKQRKYTQEPEMKVPHIALETPASPAALPEQIVEPVDKIVEPDDTIKAESQENVNVECICKDEVNQTPATQPIIASEPHLAEEKPEVILQTESAENLTAKPNDNNHEDKTKKKSERSPSPAKKAAKRERTPSPQSINHSSQTPTEEQLFAPSNSQSSPVERRARQPQQHTEQPKRYRAQPSSSGIQAELDAKRQESNTFRSLWLTQHAEIERLRAELSACRTQLETNQKAQGDLMSAQDLLNKQEKLIADQQARDYKKAPLKDMYSALLTRIKVLIPDYAPASVTEINTQNQHYIAINDMANRLTIYLFDPVLKNSGTITMTPNKKISKWFSDFANAFIQQGGFDSKAGKHFAEDDDAIKRTIQIHRFAKEADQYVTTHGIMTTCTNNGLTTTRIDMPCLVHYLDTNKLESSSLVYLIQGTECFHRNIEPLKIDVLCAKASSRQSDISEYILNPELFRKTFLAKS